jgi:hypothetical protein
MKINQIFKLANIVQTKNFLKDVVRLSPRKVVRLENLVVTPQRTPEQIVRAMRSGHVAEMAANEAGA